MSTSFYIFLQTLHDFLLLRICKVLHNIPIFILIWGTMAAIHKSSHWLNFNDVFTYTMDVCEVLYKDFLICIDQAKHGGSHGYIFFGRLDETLKIFPSKTTGTNALLHSTTEVHLFVCDVLYKKKIIIYSC